FFGFVIFVVDEVIEPAGRDHAEERFVDRPSGPGDRRLERLDLLLERRRALRFDRAGGDRALALGRHRLLARHVEDRPGGVEVAVEAFELVALAREGARRAGFARPQPARLEPGQVAAVIGEVARLPEFAVADA